MTSIGTYWRTIRHLRASQLYRRAAFRLWRPPVDARPSPPLRTPRGAWTEPPARAQSLVGPETFHLLNETHGLAEHGWDDPALSKLWRYNQHYFDDLNAAHAAARAAWHRALIAGWIADNPPGDGTGWEPYPTSLRIVNWIKWALGGGELSSDALASLAVQARWLTRRLEWHLLGNHLLANAKALLFAGRFFAGEEAAAWSARGAAILMQQLPEQILGDGGQFELSPMYHALALEDLLDLINIEACFGASGERRGLASELRPRIGAMREWLSVMSHPDGEIAFFNDAALGVAPAPPALDLYARQLGFPSLPAPGAGVRRLAASGYIRVATGRLTLLLDVARVGPDHLPGHAHADTLSFELSVGAQRVLVNSGTSEYGLGPERHRQRGTAAHNTMVLEGRNSSETWSGFRIGRRARPSVPQIVEECDTTMVLASHDGYARLPGRPVHWREWRIAGSTMVVSDNASGPAREAVVYYHFHPDAVVASSGNAGAASLPGGDVLRWRVETGVPSLEPSTYHQGFGLSLPSQRLAVRCEANRAAVRFWVEPAMVPAEA